MNWRAIGNTFEMDDGVEKKGAANPLVGTHGVHYININQIKTKWENYENPTVKPLSLYAAMGFICLLNCRFICKN